MHAIEAMGAWVGSLYGVLGFEPVDSLVVIVVRGGEPDAVMRVDLGELVHSDVVEQLADLAVPAGADGAVLVFVSAEGSARSGEFVRRFGAFGEALARRGGRLFDAVVVDRVALGGRWLCLDDCGRGGVLDDPAMSPAAAEAVTAGRLLYGTRDALSASVAADAARVAEVAPLLAGAGGEVDDVTAAVRKVVAAVRSVEAGAILTDAELAGVGAVLVDLRVRDALMTLVNCDEAAAAEQLWAQLTRVLPRPFRAEAAVMLAHSAYARGVGPLAGVCIEAVLADDPQHRMAALLDGALRRGLRPEAIRGLTATLPLAVVV